MSDSEQTSIPLLEKVLSKLKENPEEFYPTASLVERLGEPRSDINRVLYSLYSAKRLEKKAEKNGANPQWRYSDIRDKVLETLDSEVGKSPQEIASALGMTKAQVNPYLYSLKKSNLATLTTEELGKKPQWTRS